MTRHTPNATRYPIAALVAGLVGAAGLAGALFLLGIAPPLAGVAGAVLGVTIAASIKYTDQWDRAVLLRLGRYAGLRGPGYFTIIPIVDRIGYLIDQRIRTTAFGAESCLTRDTVPVNVDAIEGRRTVAWLPELLVSVIDAPVVQVVSDDTGEILYTIRAPSNRFQPGVFAPGKYTV